MEKGHEVPKAPKAPKANPDAPNFGIGKKPPMTPDQKKNIII